MRIGIPKWLEGVDGSLLKASLSLLLLLLSVTPSLGEGSNSSRTFSEELGRPVKLSIHQPFPGFVEKLLEFDTANSHIYTGDDWYSFWDADVFVYFLKDASQVVNLGDFEQQAAKYASNFDNDTFAQRVDADLTGNRKVIIKFFNASFLKEIPPGIFACKTASSLYSDIIENTEAEREVLIQSCE